MDLTDSWTNSRSLGPTIDSTVGWTAGLTVELCKHWFDSRSNYGYNLEITRQPVSWIQASDASGQLPRYEAKCVECKRFQWGSVPSRADIKGTKLSPANILIPLERQLIALQLCHWQFLCNETLRQTFRPLLWRLVWKTTNLGIWSQFWGR